MPVKFAGIFADGKGNITALLTYSVAGDDCEIVSLDSLIENRGAASYLIGMLEQEQKAQHRKRIIVSTTNDNLHALEFYQKEDLIWFA